MLVGKPYHLSTDLLAYVPGKPERCAKINYYGGFVCSEACDYRASLEMHQDMPGCGTATKPETAAMQRIRKNWATNG